MTNIEQLREKLAQLEAALLAANPNMPVLLRDIHTQIRNDPELVTLATEEELAILVSGLVRQTNTVISGLVTGSASKAATKKSLKNVTLDDL